MENNEAERISVEDLKRYMNLANEKDYILVDVRQPAEYVDQHIPGALLMPLPDIPKKMNSLPHDRDIIFYCLVGSRSRAAAMMLAEEGFTQKKVYSLEGGISQWSGMSVSRLPKIEVFDKSRTAYELLETAIGMEKGAVEFYSHIEKIHILGNGKNIFKNLAEAELSHAQMLFELLKKSSADLKHSFDEFYSNLPGGLVEGGDGLSDLIGYIQGTQKFGCIHLLDLAMDVEFASYDLYKTLANLKRAEQNVASILLTIAQAEKIHIKQISDFYPLCPEAQIKGQ